MDTMSPSEYNEWLMKKAPFMPECGDGIEKAIECTRTGYRSIKSDQYMIDYVDEQLADIVKYLDIKYEKYDVTALSDILGRLYERDILFTDKERIADEQRAFITKLEQINNEHEEYIAELEQASEHADKWIYQIADALGIPCGVGDRRVLRRIRDEVQKLQSMCNWLAKFENGSPCARGITCPYGTPSAKDPEGCNANAAKGRCWQDAARHAVERMPDNGKSCFGPKMYCPS